MNHLQNTTRLRFSEPGGLLLVAAMVALGCPSSAGAQASNFIDLNPTGCKTLVYPPVAKSARAQGTTRVVFTLGPDGKLTRLEVAQSSGMTREHRLLDRTAVDHVASCTFEADPSGQARTLRVDYVWKHGLEDLPASSPQQQAPQ
ncbi:energy transducer TonB [Aquabacterium sp.]|uniref:energy transducer TonB n=1 Tax=Aquabacterium sp. TaxID=1872578 RepID=UPI002C97940A|nr:energy transducer TonB [Aquabacterium sp.]HSW03933.1 energy transducer TonB [Aquabacterium sp.]